MDQLRCSRKETRNSPSMYVFVCYKVRSHTDIVLFEVGIADILNSSCHTGLNTDKISVRPIKLVEKYLENWQKTHEIRRVCIGISFLRFKQPFE
jgi:hypothetical protein